MVDPRVIIPRSPISELLADSLSPWVSDPDDVDFVLDLCTGSGCLAVLAALAFPNAQVDAVDVSEHALEVADQNIELSGLDGRINTHCSDFFDKLPQCESGLHVCKPRSEERRVGKECVRTCKYRGV